MSKIGMIGDPHIGARISGGSLFFLDYELDYYTNVVFPKFKENGVKNILCTGDVFHSRKNLEINVYDQFRKRFVSNLKEYGFTMWIIPGNHDLYYTDSSDVTSLSILEEYDNIKIIRTPTVIQFDGLDIGMVPWISNEE